MLGDEDAQQRLGGDDSEETTVGRRDGGAATSLLRNLQGDVLAVGTRGRDDSCLVQKVSDRGVEVGGEQALDRNEPEQPVALADNCGGRGLEGNAHESLTRLAGTGLWAGAGHAREGQLARPSRQLAGGRAIRRLVWSRQSRHLGESVPNAPEDAVSGGTEGPLFAGPCSPQ